MRMRIIKFLFFTLLISCSTNMVPMAHARNFSRASGNFIAKVCKNMGNRVDKVRTIAPNLAIKHPATKAVGAVIGILGVGFLSYKVFGSGAARRAFSRFSRIFKWVVPSWLARSGIPPSVTSGASMPPVVMGNNVQPAAPTILATSGTRMPPAAMGNNVQPSATTIHVIPVTYDLRAGSEGWKVLLKQVNGNWSDFRENLVPSKIPTQHAYDILNHQTAAPAWVGNRTNRWLATIQDTSRPDQFCFYQVDYNDFHRQDYTWARISVGTSYQVPITASIDGHVQWALRRFLHDQGIGLQTAGSQGATQQRGADRQSPLALTVPPVGAQVAYNPMPPAQGWYAVPGAILFDRDTEPSFALTNFYQEPVNIENAYTKIVETWPAVENYFQAMKTNLGATHKQLQNMAPAAVVQSSTKPVPFDMQAWDAYGRFNIMRRALEAKFARGTALGNMLMGTQGRVLVEKTYGRTNAERVWGADDGINGANHLGRMLMTIRDSMQDGQTYQYYSDATYTLNNVVGAVGSGNPLTSAR